MAFQYSDYVALPSNWDRQKYGPLDVTAVFYTQADLNYYCDRSKTTGVSTYWYENGKGKAPAYPYPGQIVSLVTGTDNKDIKIFMLIPNNLTDGSLPSSSTTYTAKRINDIDDGELT